MKKLFVLISDSGDGSYYPKFTFNEQWVNGRKEKYETGEVEWPAIGWDGDGFHYKVLYVPDECTMQSLGIFNDCSGVN